MADNNTKHTRRVALVTGGAKRIGAETCRTLHADGIDLVMHYRSSADAARKLQADLNAQRENSVVLVQGDLLELAKLEHLVQQAVEAFGRLDILVNNASAFYPTEIGKATEKDWDLLVGINMKVPFFLSQAAAPWLGQIRDTRHGNIINMADVYGERPLKGHPIYSAAKAGVIMLTRALARELGPKIRVNAVAPGAILWPENNMDELARQRILSRTSLKHIGDPSDIATTIRFLVSEAHYITGQVIAVDGGRSIDI